MNDSTRIMYLFVSGRKDRLKTQDNCAKEFFYSYNLFKDKYSFTKIVEFNEVEDYSQIFNKFLKILDKVLRKIFKFPIFMSEIVNITNLKKIRDTDVLVITNDRIGCSIIPIMIINKFRRTRYISTNVFVLGLFSNLGEKNIHKLLQKIFLNLYFSIYDNFIFIGKAEYDFANNFSGKYSYKFNYIPFCIDTDFWKIKEKKKENDILFIGNDGNRDFDKLIEISKILQEYKFIFVTNKIKKIDDLPLNVEIIEGHWNYNVLSDEELKKIYQKSKLSIVPLKNSIQPSGQSVTLQSMSLGIPVLISRTIGFWDLSQFIDNENIFMIDYQATPNEWAEKIKNILKNEITTSEIAKNGKTLVRSNFHLNEFHNKLNDLIIGKNKDG